MEERERRNVEQLRERSRGIEAPPSLEPAAVERMLSEREAAGDGPCDGRVAGDGPGGGRAAERVTSDGPAAAGAAGRGATRPPTSRLRRRRWPWAAAAACLALLIGFGTALAALPPGGGEPAFEPAPSAAPRAGEPAAPAAPGTSGGDAPDSASAAILPVAGSYEEVLAALAAPEKDVAWAEAAAVDGAVPADDIAGLQSTGGSEAQATQKSEASQASGADYADTNVRTEGVGEADIVKTDGKVIYALADDARSISLIEARAGAMAALPSLKAAEDETIIEFYVSDGRLIVITLGAASAADGAAAVPKDGCGDVAAVGDASEVRVTTYDVSDPARPRPLGTVTQSGCYETSRLADGYLYLFTNFFVGGRFEKDGDDLARAVPSVDGEVMACGDIYLPATGAARQYLVVGSLKLAEPSKMAQSKAVMSCGGELYVSDRSIYVYEFRYDDAGPQTTICKFSYGDGSIAPLAEGSVAGVVDDSFSIDEFAGTTRVVATVYEGIESDETSSTSVYVLDGSLKVIGSITGLAEDERVYAARLMGDVGYFVTFRETDPLFTVDFSNPRDPKIVGRLKIPGFSEYLHPFGSCGLLGIGMDVESDGRTTNGLKLSLFDIADPTDVREESVLTLDGVFWSPAFDDYRCVLVDAERGLVAFPVYTDESPEYRCFTYDGGQFREALCVAFDGESWLDPRGVRIEDVLYVVSGSEASSFSLGSFEKIGTLKR